MNWFRKMKIASKLGLGFGWVLALVVILGVFSLLQLSKMNAQRVDIGTNWLTKRTNISAVRLEAAATGRFELNYISATRQDQTEAEATAAAGTR